MKIYKRWQAIFVFGLLAMTISQGLAQSNEENMEQYLPDVLQMGQITYTSGGIGLEERGALEATAKQYNLIISNAGKHGEFTAGTTIVITGKDHQQLLNVNDAGPLLYVKLPPGPYVITASNRDEKAERTVSITGQQQAKMFFTWSD
jgi:hypothetical protein